jgi:YD repeat-containing protein
MNKTFHHFRLFAFNRLSEAQQIANRGLSLIFSTARIFITSLLLSMLFSQVASATDYYWITKLYPPTNYPSAPLACEGKRNLWTNDRSTCTLHGTVVSSSGETAICKMTCKDRYGRVGNANTSVFRYGNSCPVGTIYNPETGGCDKDEQKGPPPNSCETPPKAPTGFFKNPINSANGNKYQAEVDYLGSGASTLSFTRTYNSLDGLWRHNHSTYLRISGTNVALVMHHGRESFFTVSGSTVTAAPTELGNLVKTADGWQYTAETNERFTFDAAGRLTLWANGTGATQQLSHANGTVTVTDHLGYSLSFTEDAQHQPLSLTATGLQISYSYNANKRLVQLTRTRGGQTEQRQFHYEDARNNALLTGITDESGVRYATWSYDDKGRAISSEHAGGVELGTVVYNADGSSTVTNEFGKKTTYRFVSIGGVKRVSAVVGEPSANCPNSNSTFTYDTRGLLKTKTDNKGHLTTYTYNTRGLEVSRTEASGTPQARTITTEWHPTLFLPLTVTEPNRITSYSYDVQGRQLSQIQTDR